MRGPIQNYKSLPQIISIATKSINITIALSILINEFDLPIPFDKIMDVSNKALGGINRTYIFFDQEPIKHHFQHRLG